MESICLGAQKAIISALAQARALISHRFPGPTGSLLRSGIK